jgi:hypothetical protein
MLMVVMTPRERWTEEGLDNLSETVGGLRAEMRAGFDRVAADIRELRRILYGGFFMVIAAIISGNLF